MLHLNAVQAKARLRRSAMKSLPKICILFLLLPASLFAQPGVRMSADFLPLEVGNRWVYDLLNENGQKLVPSILRFKNTGLSAAVASTCSRAFRSLPRIRARQG